MIPQLDTARRGRVMFVSSILRYGGGERWMCDAATGLRDRGHPVVVVTRPRSVLGSRVRDLSLTSETVQMRGDLDPFAIRRLAGVMRRCQPDVVCVNLDREIRLCASARLLAGTASRLVPRRGSEFPLKDRWHYRWIYQHLVDCVIVNSRATKRTMIAPVPWFEADRAVVIYNGIDIAPYEQMDRIECRARLRAELGIGAATNVVTLVGELSERKGQRFVIEAAPAVIAAVSDVHFVFVGDGEARADIERRISRSGLDRYFSVLGFREDVPRIMVASDVLVLPSRVEGFGYVLAEAMAARLPVLATATSSIPEIVTDGETGFLHAFGDSRAIAHYLKVLLLDPIQRRRMGDAGYATVKERFAIDRMIEDLEDLFFLNRRPDSLEKGSVQASR